MDDHSTALRPGDWAWDHRDRTSGVVLSVTTCWGVSVAEFWVPADATMRRVPAMHLRPIVALPVPAKDAICFTAAASRIIDTLNQDTLLAALEGAVIPLPHQLAALERALASDRTRFLLADEVGLGKTIEAGLIFRELKVRGMVRRVLVVAPTGLVQQWSAEMSKHFGETFRVVVPADFPAMRAVTGADRRENLWRTHDQVICPLDGVKPLDARRGWNRAKVDEHNRQRVDDLVTAGWDLIIIDEAHRLGGSTDSVARYRLGDSLSKASPFLLLLSATPHQGKSDAFRRLIRFLDPDALGDDTPVTRSQVAPFVIRTEKRKAIDAAGDPLFKPRITQVVKVGWDVSRAEQRALYDAVTEYVRVGYNQAMREKKTAIGFLMILMQRLVTSSTAAIRTALERRLEVLGSQPDQLVLASDADASEWQELDGDAQLDAALATFAGALRNERAEVELLLSSARTCEARGPDVKAEALLAWFHTLEREAADPRLKFLVFTEFVPTQAMLATYLRGHGYQVECLNGSLGMDARKTVQASFADDAQVLISTDAGGEGLNLQFCHVIFNFDLPWNPMKIEQRIGRVDRIGQTSVVRALNFSLEDTVELRVREVLEEKLRIILEEFGVDKLGDVLDSEEGGADFDALFTGAVVSPEDAERRAEELARRIRDRAIEARETSGILPSADLDPDHAMRIASHQLPFWTERMTVSWLRAQPGDSASVTELPGQRFTLRWPDGTSQQRVSFAREDGTARTQTRLSIEDDVVRKLLDRVAPLPHGAPVARIAVGDGASELRGYWSLWRIGFVPAGGRDRRILPVFVTDDGASLVPTARILWDRIIAGSFTVVDDPVDRGVADDALNTSRAMAGRDGKTLWDEVRTSHRDRIERETRRVTQATDARRSAIARLADAADRAYQFSVLDRDSRDANEALRLQREALPELTCLALVRVGPATATTVQE